MRAGSDRNISLGKRVTQFLSPSVARDLSAPSLLGCLRELLSPDRSTRVTMESPEAP